MVHVYASVAPEASSVASKTAPISSIAAKAAAVSSEDSSTVAANASVSITARYGGDLGTKVEPVAIAGEVYVRVTVRETVNLRYAHDTQTPELIWKTNTTRQITG